jgi:phosphate:Na+ symporter
MLKRTLNPLMVFIVLLVVTGAGICAAQNNGTLTISKPSVTSGASGSGDAQHQTAGLRLSRPLRVRATNPDGKAAEGISVRFAVVSAPDAAKGTGLSVSAAATDGDGYASTVLQLGSAPGTYLVSAAFDNPGDGTGLVIFTATARKSKWIFTLVVGLIGGLGIFLFGLKIMSEGLKKTAAGRIRSVLSKLTLNRFVAVAAGAFVTMLIQSSSATTVMLVSFVRAGLMTFAQTIGIILGADVGTTITAQLIAFQLTDYALLLIGIGIAVMLLSKRERLQDVGETGLGFGLLFFGMQIMSDAMGPLKTHEGFVHLLVSLENPLLGIAVGTMLTAVIQSSAAFTGILIVLATQGLVSLESAIPLLFGANIGTCVTALLAGLGTSREAQRVAIAHIVFKLVGVALFVWWIPEFADLIRRVSPAGDPSLTGTHYLADVLPRQVANAHTIFNVGLVLVMLPFSNVVAKLITRFYPDRPVKTEPPCRTRYIDEALLSTPALALNLAKAEVLHLSGIVGSMIKKNLRPFFDYDRDVLAELARDEEQVNYLSDAIQDYLGAISRKSLAEDRITEVFQMMYTVTELEQIGDIITKNLVPRAREWLDANLKFSGEGRDELLDFHLKSIKQFSRAMEVFADVNLEAASRIKKKHERYRQIQDQYLKSHYERIRKHIPETLETREYHQELMEQLRRITSHSTRIARIQLSWAEETAAGKSGKK